MTSGSPVVAVRDLRVCDGSGRVVLDGGELTVAAGRVTALVGPSGSGKSTLLRAVAGALPAGLYRRSGTVRVLGHDLHVLPDERVRALRRERIGFVGQDPAAGLNPRMRVHRLLSELAAESLDVRSLLAEVRLPNEVLRRRPGQLSGGQQRRVALARGLARRPSLLLLDEPTAGMDSRLRKEITDLLRDLADREGLTVVLACHDPEVVAAVADDVVDLGGGPAPLAEVAQRTSAERREPALSVLGLSAWVGGRRILTDVSFDLAAGETVAVTGESGTGKTTLARVVAGLHRSARAELTLAGEPLAVRVTRRKPVQRRQVQLVPQDPRGTLNPSRTVHQTVARPLALHGLRQREAVPARVAELLDRVDLAPDVADRYPHELSGGQRQRVAIARALAAEPTVLLCDEVTSALDGHTADSVMALLADLRATGLAVMLISHDLPLVRRHADRVLELGATTPP